MRFWKYLIGSMVRVSGVIMVLFGLGSSAFEVPVTIGIPIAVSGVVLYLIGRKPMISSRDRVTTDPSAK